MDYRALSWAHERDVFLRQTEWLWHPYRGATLRRAAATSVTLLLAVAVFVLWLLGRPSSGGWTDLGVEIMPWEKRLTVAGATVTGIGAVIALVVSYRKQRDVEEGRFAALFAEAAAQLGNPSPAVRIAGVYALGALADRYEEHRQQVIDALCGYLRLPYDLAAGRGHLTTRTIEGRGQAEFGYDPPVVTKTESYRPADREVRLTIIRVIRDHLRTPRQPASWCGYDLDFMGAVFDGGDFSDSHFTGGTVTFDNAQFSDGKMSFKGAQFTGGTVTFNSAQFNSDLVSFDQCKFSGGDVTFNNAQFGGGNVIFTLAQFASDSVTFTYARFSGGRVDFGGSKVGGTISFYGADFTGGVVALNGLEINHGRLEFNMGRFSQECCVTFQHAISTGGTIAFVGARFTGGHMFFDAAEFSCGGVSFERALFTGGSVTFNETRFAAAKVLFGTPYSDGTFSFAESPVGVVSSDGNVFTGVRPE